MAEKKQSNGLKEKDKGVLWVEEHVGDHPTKGFKYGRLEWCYAFYRGEQYKIYDERKGTVREVNIPRECRSIRNYCRPFADAFVSKMLKGDPIPDSTPFSTNTEDFDENLSLAFKAVSEYWWKSVIDAPVKLRGNCRWGAITGIGIAKVPWNKKLKSGIYTGDLDWIVCNPAHVVFNADARSRDEIRWGCHFFPKDKALVEEEFNLEKDSLTADDKAKAEEDRTYSTKSLDHQVTAEDSSGTVIVYDIWIKECGEYPSKYIEKDKENRGGRHMVVAGGKTLVDEDYWGSEDVPFEIYQVGDLLDDLYGHGVIYPILTIQRDINRLSSIIMENASLMGLIKWMIPEQGNYAPNAFTDEGGEKLPYTYPYVATQTQASPLPQHIVGQIGELIRAMQFLTKMQDVGMGMIPYRGSQTSPGVVKELKQSQEELFSVEMAQMAEFVVRIMKRFRKYSKHYYIEDRIIQIMGENKRMEAVTYKAKDDNNDYNFDYKAGEGFSKSDEAIVSQITTLAQTEFFEKAGVDMRVVGEEVMRRTGLTKIKEDTFKDKRQAQRYLDMVLNNVRPIISKYINPDAHIKVFRDFIVTPEYDTLNDGIKFSLDWYIDQCNAMKQGLLTPQKQPVMPKGGVGGGGNPQQQMMVPQTMAMQPTEAEKAEAALNRSSATGQPVTDMGQAANSASPGV